MSDVPWVGGRAWEMMYDFPRHAQIKSHLSINAVWRICEVLHRIRNNNGNIDRAAWLKEQRTPTLSSLKWLGQPHMWRTLLTGS